MNTQPADHASTGGSQDGLSQTAGEGASLKALTQQWLAQKFELSRGNGAPNIKPMEGLRGFAVFLVFLVHYVTLVTPWIPEHSAVTGLAESLHTLGNAGVDLFFVLSGYLIYGSLISRRQNFFRFMSRRVERIYPTFLVVFAVYVALSYAFPAENKIPATITAGVVYVMQNLLLLPGLFPIDPVITVAWSLSYEMFYYLAIPAIVGLFGLRGRSVAWRAGFFMATAVLIAIYCAVYEGPIRLIMFISGILLYEALASGRVPTPSSALALLAVIAGLLGMVLPTQGSGGFVFKTGLLFVAFFMLCLTCFRTPSNWLPRAFTWTPLRWLGNMSYSYYLLHGLALKAAFMALAKILPIGVWGAWLFWALLPLMFLLTLVPTAALFLGVERPFSLAPRKIRGRAPGVSLEAAPANAANS